MADSLGSTNPKLIDIASETSSLRHLEFSSRDSLLMSAFSLLPIPVNLTVRLHYWQDAPLPPAIGGAPSSVGYLAPIILGARSPVRRNVGPIQVSCYALFEGWLLLSQPPCCVGDLTTFPLKNHLGTLDESLGCFPFAETSLSRLD